MTKNREEQKINYVSYLYQMNRIETLYSLNVQQKKTLYNANYLHANEINRCISI